jgi:hypothetical protein
MKAKGVEGNSKGILEGKTPGQVLIYTDWK